MSSLKAVVRIGAAVVGIGPACGRFDKGILHGRIKREQKLLQGFHLQLHLWDYRYAPLHLLEL